jgi:hypothetical protein
VNPLARVCLDGTFFNIDAGGNLTFIRSSVGLQQTLTFTTPGTTSFTKASFPGLTRLRVRVIGGGGGAAGATSTATTASTAAGAGGGGYSESVLNASALGASETIVVGAGGLGGIGAGAGTPGGTSSFGGFVIAFGGPNSVNVMPPANAFGDNNATPGAPVGTGQIAVPGGVGENSDRWTSGVGHGGMGGISGGAYGIGGTPAAFDQLAGPGLGYGGGGGGGAASVGFTFNGGAGAPGAVFLDLYY